MKYKGIKLEEGDNFEAELCIAVEFSNPNSDDDLTESIEKKVFNKLIKNNVSDFYIETVLSDLTLVRSFTGFSFDRKGVAKLAEVYSVLSNVSKIKPFVSVHLDEWFKEDGNSFNEDMVTLKDFLENVEY